MELLLRRHDTADLIRPKDVFSERSEPRSVLADLYANFQPPDSEKRCCQQPGTRQSPLTEGKAHKQRRLKGLLLAHSRLQADWSQSPRAWRNLWIKGRKQ